MLVRALRSSVTSRIASLRQPPTAARLARALWIIWAIIVWNVVFDQVIVRAGRDYLVAAGQASAKHALRPDMDAYMRPAAQRQVDRHRRRRAESLHRPCRGARRAPPLQVTTCA